MFDRLTDAAASTLRLICHDNPYPMPLAEIEDSLLRLQSGITMRQDQQKWLLADYKRLREALEEILQQYVHDGADNKYFGPFNLMKIIARDALAEPKQKLGGGGIETVSDFLICQRCDDQHHPSTANGQSITTRGICIDCGWAVHGAQQPKPQQRSGYGA